MEFETGATLTRKQIAEALGGMGPGVLPAKDGKVVCGVFDLGANAVTHLSGEIDVYPKTVPKAAKSLDSAIPVFVKISTQLYRYLGEYLLDETDTSKKALDGAKKELGRDDIGAVMRFKPAKPSLKVVSKG